MLELQEREPMKITSYLSPSPSRLIYLASLLVFSFFSSATFACTTDFWNGGVTGSPLADSPNSVDRVSGLCAMKLSASGSVKDTSPLVEPSIVIRFYVKATVNSGAPVIVEAFSDDAATASLINVTFDGSNFVFDAGDGNSGNVPGRSGWNLVEITWVGGVGLEYWVNTDSSGDATGAVSAAGGTVESVVLGPLAGLDGELTFDDYVSHREMPVGGLLIGDANNDGAVNLFDISATLLEVDFFNPVVQEGTPDCNMDGQVDLFDISATLLAIDFFNPTPCESN
jgi:hypothetical protein